MSRTVDRCGHLLVRDALGLVVLTFSRRAGGFILGNGWLAFALIVTCTGLALAGVREAVSAPRVRQVEVVLPGPAAEFEGYRMVHLSDLHVSRPLTRSWLDEVVRAVNAQRPDAVLISGDLMDGTPEARARDSLVLGDLRARDGLFAVPGNHNYFGDFEEWLSSLRKLGFDVLLNEHRIIRRGDARLVFAGVTDPVAPSRRQPEPDVLRGCPGAAAPDAPDEGKKPA